MRFRTATAADIPQICALERRPEFRTMVGSWPEDQHHKMIADPGSVYIVAEDQLGEIAGFVILQGLLSEHRAVEVKRIVVGAPNQGTGKRFSPRLQSGLFANMARTGSIWTSS